MKLFRARRTWVHQPRAWFPKPISLYFWFFGLFSFEFVPKPKPVVRWYPFRATWNFVHALATIILSFRSLMFGFKMPDYRHRLFVTDHITFGLTVMTWYVPLVVSLMVIPWRVSKFFKFVEKINEVDVALKASNASNFKSRKWRSFTLGLLFIVIGFTRMGIGCTTYFNTLIHVHFWERFGNYFFFCWVRMITPATSVVVAEIQNVLIARLMKFNQLMETKVSNMKSEVVGYNILLPVKSEVISIEELFGLYLKLVKAAEVLNNFVKEYVVVILVVGFIQMIPNLYWIFTELYSMKNFYLVLSISLNVFLIVVMIATIIEPSYQCIVQTNLTKRYLSHMMTTNLSKEQQNKIKRFGYATKLRQIQVSACGFFQVDRSLFVSICEIICSYLVILMQMYIIETKIAGE